LTGEHAADLGERHDEEHGDREVEDDGDGGERKPDQDDDCIGNQDGEQGSPIGY
jgi:hypothetical protein